MSSKDKEGEKEKKSSSKDKEEKKSSSSSHRDKEEKKDKSSSSKSSSSHKKKDGEEGEKKEKKEKKEKEGDEARVKELEAQLAQALAQLEAKDKAHKEALALLAPKGSTPTPTPAPTAAPLEAADQGPITFEPVTGSKVRLRGEWKGRSAGGSLDEPTWRFNPQYFLTVESECKVTITVQQPPSGLVGLGWYLFEAPTDQLRRILADPDTLLVGKAKMAKAEQVTATFTLKKGKTPYVIMPATHTPATERPFALLVEASAPVTLQLLPPTREWLSVQGDWTGPTAGGCPNFDSFPSNPQWLLQVDRPQKVTLRLLQTAKPDFDAIALYLTRTEAGRTQKVAERAALADASLVAAAFESEQEFAVTLSLQAGAHVVVPCTFNPGQEGTYDLILQAEGGVHLTELRDGATLSLEGEWRGAGAGGCLNEPSKWRRNAQMALWVKKDLELTLSLRQTHVPPGTDLVSLGFYLFKGGRRVVRPSKKNLQAKSKFLAQRDGVVERVRVAASSEPYLLVPCTYDAGVEAHWALTVRSTDPTFLDSVTLAPLPPDRDLLLAAAPGEWAGPTAGGCLNYATWRNNPQFLLEVREPSEVQLFLSVDPDVDNLQPGFYLTSAPTTMQLCVDLTPDRVLHKGAFRQSHEIQKLVHLEPGRYSLVACTWAPGQEAAFEVAAWCSTATVSLSPVKTGLLTLKGEWGEGTAGGCINDVALWRTNPHLFIAAKQHVECALVLIQEQRPPEQLLEIGLYVTASDGEGQPKVSAPSDLLAASPFAPDRDVVAICTLPACHWPYVLTPCTFRPGLTGKFEVHLLTDWENLAHLEFRPTPMAINPEEVLGAGESYELRELKRRYKTLGPAVIEAVKITERLDLGVPEYMQWIGRQLLQTAAQFQDGLVAWTNEEEPAYWTDYFAEEEAQEEVVHDTPPPPPPGGGPPPPPPPPKKVAPPVNFSKPVKLGMISTERTSNMTEEQMAALEGRQSTQLYVDEMLSEIKGGLAKLKKATPLPPKPKVEDPLVCAFNLSVLTTRRAAIEGLNDTKDEDDWDDWE